MAAKRLTLVGSTGSVGRQTLDEVRRRGDVEVVGLSCARDIAKMEPQIREFRPRFAAVLDGSRTEELREMVKGTRTEVFGWEEGVLRACVRCDTDLVVIASVGLEAFRATFEAVSLGKDIAPASKEPFVFGADVLLPVIKKNGVRVYPIDSEHSAVWQCVLEKSLGGVSANGDGCIVGIDTSNVNRVWLGCSGGPFYGETWEELKKETVERAIKHPTWNMGGLITINSATLYNKGQEISEARALFGLGKEQIGVTVDTTSMIHAIVEFKDGSRLMNMSKPDMHDPIRFALFGERNRDHIRPADGIKIVDPDRETFRLLRKAEEAMDVGGTMPAAMVAANGAAVEHFLNRTVGFTEMIGLVEEAMLRHPTRPATFDNIVEAYEWGDWIVRDMIMARRASDPRED